MSFDLSSLTQAVDAHGHVARILIASHKGSSPREAGTSMLVWDAGFYGTIGGGALEYQAVEMAQKHLQSKTLTSVQRIPLGPNLGQCCGGSVTLVTECFTQANLPQTDTIFARPIQVGSPEPLWVKRNLANARNGAETPDTQLQDGWLVESISQPLQPVWIYGAGHVGRAIIDTLQGLPFDITWVDTKGARFPADIPENVTQLVAQNPALAAIHAPHDAQHFILTYSHAIDLELCHAILSNSFKSVGLIGSKTKHARFITKLQNLGHSAPQISRIICPIGDPSLGKEPKAIALGITSALIRERANVTAQKEAQI
ncbi:MAG: xanthine dehydrogenase accessory protein XdhC [Amylibacter sp.]|nr:xanthine dehydrogenase accessory protein XdhC [Amylibacter sp.]